MVNVASGPLSKREARGLLEGGNECLSGLDMYANGTLYDAILATTSITKDYIDDLKLLQDTPNPQLSGIENRISDGMMDNIRKILIVLQSSSPQMASFNEICRKYLLKTTTTSASTSRGGRDWNSLLKCYRTLAGLKKNDGFVGDLTLAFTRARELIRMDNNDGDPRWLRTVPILKRIKEYQLRAPPSLTMDDLTEFIADLEGLSDSDSDSD